MSAKTPWTPGPWNFTVNIDDDLVILNAKGHILATVSDREGEYDRESAMLIAYAPEMAELLEKFATRRPDFEMIEAARALLARIKGE